MKQKPTLAQKLQYAFDNTLVSGSSAIIAWLAVLSAVLVIVFGIVYTITGISMPDSEGMGFFEAAWQALMRSVDPGTVAGDEGWSFRLIGVLITIGGIFILSTLIGALTTGLEEKLDDLRKGRSLVLEENHTLILGWSDKIFHIIEQLVIANESEARARIVILAPRDKVEMEDELKSRLDNLRTTRIICRTGSPLIPDDIALVNPDDARSIIVLAPESEDPDTYVIKSVLAVTNNPQRKPEPYHIVAEIDDEENMEAAQLVGQGEAIYVRSSSMLARIAAQTCRQSGLSMIYSDVLDYEGDEIYFQPEPALEGKTYKEALFSYEKSAVLGLMRGNSGEILINPPMDTVIGRGDSVIAVSEDDTTVKLSGRVESEFDEQLFSQVERAPEQPEKNVLLGWNAKGVKIIQELDKYVAPGSVLTVIAEREGLADRLAELGKSMQNQKIELIIDDITRRRVLDRIDFSGSRNVIILTYTTMPVQEADAKTLITLLHLRSIAEQQNTRFNIVSEMGDIKNRELAEVARADDFIIGDNLISRLMAQLSETRRLQGVFGCLFNAEGAEIYLRSAAEYVQPGQQIDFYTLLEAAARKGETAIGYRVMAQAREYGSNYGIRLNPLKSERFTLSADDRVIVVADD